jgi:probable HAF family extracellular repeat protein
VLTYGINDSGQIVGYYNGQGVLLDHGSYTTVQVLGSRGTVANGINASGQIVGSYFDDGGNSPGFLFDNGNYTSLDVPGSFYTYATGINASGAEDSTAVHGSDHRKDRCREGGTGAASAASGGTARPGNH